MQNTVYIIGIGGIGVSAIARYYLHQGWKVYGSDKTDSELIHQLTQEGCDIIIGEDIARIERLGKDPLEETLVVYTEAIPDSQSELMQARKQDIRTRSYPQALGDIVNTSKLITVAGTHGKSTTTSLTSLVLKDSENGVNAIIGTILKEFGNKNTHFSESDTFVIEACEYKRSFLQYRPAVAVITNIEVDHLDYYKDEADYLSAFTELVEHVIPDGFVILDKNDRLSKKLMGLREDIHYITIDENVFQFGEEVFQFPEIHLQIPGKHILYDAHLAYIVGFMFGIPSDDIVTTLENYTGVWRRMEIIGTTEHENILMSDYGHHPTEISLTLGAIKERHPEKHLYVVFQPHQYNRTIELLDGFSTCFYAADTLVIPDIYESRDSEEDKQKINASLLVKAIDHPNIYNGD
ncbi:MAG: hypothetical protein H6767_09980 [Candidatus Peribacteria bacterium]|nr:MAG: hypothetical protein H6767_09980 [Candidatus Peribacteria bacterium]